MSLVVAVRCFDVPHLKGKFSHYSNNPQNLVKLFLFQTETNMVDI